MILLRIANLLNLILIAKRSILKKVKLE